MGALRAGASTFTQLSAAISSWTARSTPSPAWLPAHLGSGGCAPGRVSKGVVTYHFAAKDDLISAVIAHVLAR